MVTSLCASAYQGTPRPCLPFLRPLTAGSQVNTVMGHRSTNGETVWSPWGAGQVPKWDRVEKKMF